MQPGDAESRPVVEKRHAGIEQELKIPDTASHYSLGWVQDEDPRWDPARARVFSTVSEDMFPAGLRIDGRPLPGVWWRVTDGATAIAFGWLQTVSSRAVALLAVADTALQSGAKGFGVIRLGEEAAARGFDRVVEMRQRKHPEHAAVTVWVLARRGWGHGAGASTAESAGDRPSRG